jgi:hypothetical protein
MQLVAYGVLRHLQESLQESFTALLLKEEDKRRDYTVSSRISLSFVSKARLLIKVKGNFL